MEKGAIIKNTKTGEVGIYRHKVTTDSPVVGPAADGDWVIFIAQGITTVTNKFDDWELVPLELQTTLQRYWSCRLRGEMTHCANSIPCSVLEFLLYGRSDAEVPTAAELLLRLIDQ